MKKLLFIFVAVVVPCTILLWILYTAHNYKPVKYRIEQLYYKNGKNFAGTMWNDSKKINDNTYSYHIPEHFNQNSEICESGFDSVIFKIVEVK